MFCFSQIKSLPSDEPDQTIEILMSELDPKVREVGPAALIKNKIKFSSHTVSGNSEGSSCKVTYD
jgi:hypothetical protein